MLALMHDRDTVCRDCVSLISMTSPFLARSGVEAAIPQGYRLLRMWGAASSVRCMLLKDVCFESE
jgi:hypothetical protein